MSAARGAWLFSDSHLSRALEEWQQREGPTPERVDAVYDWCLSVVDTGPSDADTMPIAEADDLFVAFVPAADAFVTFLAVFQDQSIFVRSIEGSA